MTTATDQVETTEIVCALRKAAADTKVLIDATHRALIDACHKVKHREPSEVKP